MTLDQWVLPRLCVNSRQRSRVASDRGIPQGGLITMCHVAVCNPAFGIFAFRRRVSTYHILLV
jgi:hypothetical protein